MEVLVPIIKDTIAEGTEEFLAKLDGLDPNDVKLGDEIAIIMIIDNDGAYVCVLVHACVCVFENLPVKEGGRKIVHFTLSQ